MLMPAARSQYSRHPQSRLAVTATQLVFLGAALAGRIKYMVDTPEMIYSSLDAGDTLASALRFCRCRSDRLLQICCQACDFGYLGCTLLTPCTSV